MYRLLRLYCNAEDQLKLRSSSARPVGRSDSTIVLAALNTHQLQYILRHRELYVNEYMLSALLNHILREYKGRTEHGGCEGWRPQRRYSGQGSRDRTSTGALPTFEIASVSA